jgi:hypothetical protein
MKISSTVFTIVAVCFAYLAYAWYKINNITAAVLCLGVVVLYIWNTITLLTKKNK